LVLVLLFFEVSEIKEQNSAHDQCLIYKSFFSPLIDIY